MKRLLLIFSILSLVCACNADVMGTIYDEDNLGSGFSFAGTVLNAETAAEDEGIVRIPVYRGKTAFEQILIAEGFQDIGWSTTPDEYLQIEVRQNGTVRYDEFRNGMYLQKQFIIYGVYAPERKEHLDVDLSKFTNTRLDEKTFELYPFYYIKNYGYLADPYKMLITLP